MAHVCSRRPKGQRRRALGADCRRRRRRLGSSPLRSTPKGVPPPIVEQVESALEKEFLLEAFQAAMPALPAWAALGDCCPLSVHSSQR